MASWAAKRKLTYLGIFFGAAIIFIGVPFFVWLYRAPTCSDRVQNQGEQGVDCGGPCSRLCAAKFLSPLIDWQRFFQVAPGVYHVLAYVENPNLNAGIANVSYTFRLFDEKNVNLVERTGQTFIAPGAIIPIFEPSLQTGERTPARLSFTFNGNENWQEFKNVSTPSLKVTRRDLISDNGIPRLNVTILNTSRRDLKRFEVVTVLYDAAGNAANASRTFVDALPADNSADLVFTWRQPFSAAVSKIDILPLLYPGIQY